MGRLISGKVFDAETNQPLAFAVVAVTDAEGNPIQPVQHVTTNPDGSFRMNIEGVEGGTHVGAKYTGYPKMVKPIAGNTDFNFPMNAGIELKKVTVEADGKGNMIPSWLLWIGVGLGVAGIGMLVISKTKN